MSGVSPIGDGTPQPVRTGSIGGSKEASGAGGVGGGAKPRSGRSFGFISGDALGLLVKTLIGGLLGAAAGAVGGSTMGPPGIVAGALVGFLGGCVGIHLVGK